MQQNAKQLLKRISEKVGALTDKKISQVAHAPGHNEWRAYIWQTQPHWEDIAWRVKEPNNRGEAEVHLGFYSAKPSEELAQAISKSEKLAKGKVSHIIKNENGIRLVWKVNLNDSNSLDKLFEEISNLISSFLDIAIGALLKSDSHEEGTGELNESNQEIAELTNEQINWIETNDGWDFDKADPIWKSTKAFVIKFMQSKQRSIFSNLTEELKNDVDIAKTAIAFDASDVLRNLPESLKNNNELIKQAIEKDGTSIRYLPNNLKFKKEFLILAIRKSYKAISDLYDVPDELLNDKLFINEICTILKEHIVSNDWKEVLPQIPFKILDQTNEDFRSFFENLTREGISKYRMEVSKLTFDPNNPTNYRLNLENIYRTNLPSGNSWSSPFKIDGSFNYDSENNIADWGSEALLYDTFYNEYFENIWKPAMENANLEQLIKMIPSTYRIGNGDFMKDNDVAIDGYNRVIEFIKQGEDITVGQLFDLLNACEERFVLRDEAIEVYESLINELRKKENEEIFLSLIEYRGEYFVSELFKEEEKKAFADWIELKLSKETDENIIADLKNVKEDMNSWEY